MGGNRSRTPHCSVVILQKVAKLMCVDLHKNYFSKFRGVLHDARSILQGAIKRNNFTY